MKVPEPLIIAWRGQRIRIRHDDPQLTIYSPHGARLRAAIELAGDVEGLRLVLASTVTDRYSVKVADDGSVVGLWRLDRPDRHPERQQRMHAVVR